MSSISIYTPYFYIIKHTHTNKRYAGIRYAAGCHPSEFMKPGGYQTSSKHVKDLIKRDGLDSFVIERIDTDFCGMEPLEYEAKFLCENDCASSGEWLNLHNGLGMSLHSPEYNSIMTQLYGTVHSMQIPAYRKKANSTMAKRYGVECFSKSLLYAEIMKEKRGDALVKAKQTSLSRYGVEIYSQTEEFNEKVKQTNLKKRGVEHHTQTDEHQQKRREESLLKRGVDHHMKDVENRSQNGCFLNEELRLISCSKGGKVQGKRNAETGHLTRLSHQYWDDVKTGKKLRDKIWVTDGKSNKLIDDDGNMLSGFARGRTENGVTRLWFTNGQINAYVDTRKPIPKGFYIGFTNDVSENNIRNGKSYWCNDGTTNLRLVDTIPLPEGFKRGRIKWKQK